MTISKDVKELLNEICLMPVPYADVRITLDIYDSVDNNDFLNAVELLKDRFPGKTKKAAYKLLL